MWIKCKVEWHEPTDGKMTALFNYAHGMSFQKRKVLHWYNDRLYPTDLYIKSAGKLIASSNLSLNTFGIPKLSEELLADFCKDKFEEIMVEFDDDNKSFKLIDGAIVTRPVKTTWTKEEVIEFICNKFDTYYMNYVTAHNHNRYPLHYEIERWLEKNLQ